MAHRHGVYGGMQASAVTKDGYGHNHRLLWAIFDKEDKQNWVHVTDKIAEKLPRTKFVISDQTKGLESIRISGNAQARSQRLQRALLPSVDRSLGDDLPPNWLRIHDHDQVYYHNTFTKTSQWKKPVVLPLPRNGFFDRT